MAINPLDHLLGDPDPAAPSLGYGGIDRSQPELQPLLQPVRTIKVYNHPDPSDPSRLLPVKRRVSKQEERGGLSARAAKRARMADLRELTKEQGK